MFADRAHDLADAIIAYAENVGLPVSEQNQAHGMTWYRFDAPPNNWEGWTGNMGPDDHDAMVAAGSQETRGQVSRAVSEAATRLKKPEMSYLYDEGIDILGAATVGSLAIYQDDATNRHYLADAADVLALVRTMSSTRDYAAWHENRSSTGNPHGYHTHEAAVRAAHQITNAAAKAAVAAADAGRAAR